MTAHTGLTLLSQNPIRANLILVIPMGRASTLDPHISVTALLDTWAKIVKVRQAFINKRAKFDGLQSP